MVDPVNDFDTHVGARLLDFFNSRSPWHLKLWNVGLCMTLQEILEAADAVRAGVLHEESFGYLANSAQQLAGTDPGVGSPEQRRLLQQSLRSKPRFAGLDYELVAQHEARCRAAYLSQWAAALRRPDHPRAERTARAVASHLLDLGFSSDFLHRWWSYRLHHQRDVRTLADLLEEAQRLALGPARDFEVIVPVVTAIHVRVGTPPAEWRNAPAVTDWLRAEGFDPRGVRQDGGFLLTIQARDADAAVARSVEALDQLSARMAVSTRRVLRPLGRVWVKGERAPHAIDPAKRGVWVEALEREGQIYDLRAQGGMHAAIELLSHLQSSSPGAAAAGGWAAIEALVAEPSDRAGAADRLAMLVACSFPRAELTRLSYAIPHHDPGISSLNGILENRERCQMLLKMLEAGRVDLTALRPSDRAAASRMLELLRDPHRILEDIRGHATSAFRRLYRQRNFVLHWGKTDGVALRASLRTAAPLVGAGIDRIVHADYVDRLSPLQLVARAKTALATVGSPAGPACAELLG